MTDIKLEDAMKRLTEIVKSLEQNEVTLDDSLKLFEEGVGLTRSCQSKLSDVERRIEVLTKVSANGVETKPYENKAN